MFKHYIDISDVVSLLVHCPAEKSFLLTKESSGEYWIPSFKAEKNSWKKTAQKMNFELFGMDAGYNCQPIRVYKVWLPNHRLACVHHVVYKVIVKPEIKKRAKLKAFRTRLLWMTAMELERQRAHTTLRSPEVCVFTQIVTGVDYSRETQVQEMETGILIEICEENVIVGDDAGGGAVSVATPNCALLHAANYSREDQARLYREFLVMVFPALYMSPFVFTQFMVELGWQRAACLSLFRAADVTGRGGLSFMEMMLWAAALEPSTPHNGIPAEIRCRYIFRFFDSNRDMKLEYVEFKELVAAVRAARQLAVDALSVARDADVCQLGLQPNMQLPLAEFLRCVDELRLRGTSSLLRSPKSISGYLIDLQGRDAEFTQSTSSKLLSVAFAPTTSSLSETTRLYSASGRPAEFNIATYTVKLRKRAPVEMCELANYDDEAVSQSTARILAKGPSMEVLSLKSNPAEALSAVHLFAAAIERNKRDSIASKPAWSWSAPSDESNLGSLLLKLANAVRQLCMDEPRMLRVSSPVYAIGDLHGNLEALLAMESVLWPTGPALAPARLLFLGDFVDRGPHGAELMAYLLAAKLQRPAGVLLVRGNHETRDIQKMFTFYNECVAKYGDTEGPRVWNAINMVFDVLPLAAVVDDKIFCCHGGIPPPWVCPVISAINKVPMPLPRPAEQSSIAWELLWNDPINKVTATQQLELSANEGFAANSKRGTGHVFDQTALDRFLLANQLTHVLRAHQLHLNGFMCQLRGRLVSVFSSSHYCGSNNEAGVALIDGGKLRLMKLCDE